MTRSGSVIFVALRKDATAEGQPLGFSGAFVSETVAKPEVFLDQMLKTIQPHGTIIPSTENARALFTPIPHGTLFDLVQREWLADTGRMPLQQSPTQLP